MRTVTGEELLQLPVRMHGIPLGQPIDLVVDLEGRRAVGLDVLCGDDTERFLPLAAATVREDEIHVESALILLDDAAPFYRRRATTLRALRGAAVARAGVGVGEL